MICALVQSILYRRNNNRSQVSLPLSVSPPLPPPAGQRETNQVSGRKNEVNEVRILAVSYKYQRRSWRFCLFFHLSSFCFFLSFAPLNWIAIFSVTQAHRQQASSHWAATIIRPNERRRGKGKEEDDDDDDGGVGITCLVAEAVLLTVQASICILRCCCCCCLLTIGKKKKEKRGKWYNS